MVGTLKHISNMVARRVQKFSDGWAAHYWHDYPFGRTPRATEEQYRALWEEERKNAYFEIDAFEKGKGYAAPKDWLDDLALHTQIVVKDSPLCYQHGRVLYTALREYLAGVGQSKINIVETGTARGFSSVVMAKALVDAEIAGQIMTFDVLPHHTKMYWNCIDDVEGLKTRAELLAPWREFVDSSIIFIEGDSRIMMKKAVLGRVHFAFLDGAHTYKDVMAELKRVVPYQKSGDVIVFDDYSENVFPGLVRAVDEGCEGFGYDKNVVRSNDQRAYVIAKKK